MLLFCVSWRRVTINWSRKDFCAEYSFNRNVRLEKGRRLFGYHSIDEKIEANCNNA